MSRVKSPLLRCKASTDDDSSLSCNVAYVLCFSSVNMLNLLGSSVLDFLLNGAAMLEEFGTNRQYTLHDARNHFNSLTLCSGIRSRIALGV